MTQDRTHGDAVRHEVLVRSSWHAVTVPGQRAPYDVAHLKVYYPATSDGSDDERQTGELAPDRSRGPLPVVVFLNGVNVSQESYRWLAIELVRGGFAVVTYDYVGELMPGYVGLSPGLDLGALAPGVYGTRPTGDVLAPVLAELARLSATGPFEGLFDLDRLAFGGHSAGGTVALQSARRAYFPGLRAVFSYAGHTVASTMLGLYPPGTVLPCADDVSSLLISGTEDGVFAASAGKYGTAGDDPVTATFEHGLPDGADGWLVHLKGANHFAIGTHEDPSAARGFLDGVARVPVEETRETLVALVTAFLGAALLDAGPGAAARRALDDLEASPPPTVELIRRR